MASDETLCFKAPSKEVVTSCVQFYFRDCKRMWFLPDSLNRDVTWTCLFCFRTNQVLWQKNLAFFLCPNLHFAAGLLSSIRPRWDCPPLSLSLFRPISVRLRVFNWCQDPSVSRSPVLPRLFRPATVMNMRVEVEERSLQLHRQLTTETSKVWVCVFPVPVTGDLLGNVLPPQT